MVPPIADNMSENLAALSLVIMSNVGVSKYILTNLILFFHSKSEIIYKCKYMQNYDTMIHNDTKDYH